MTEVYRIEDLVLRLEAGDMDPAQNKGVRNALWALYKHHPEGTCSEEPEYEEILQKGGYSAGTARTYNGNLKRFFVWLDEHPLVLTFVDLGASPDLSRQQKDLLVSLSELGLKGIRPVLLRQYVDKLLKAKAITEASAFTVENDLKAIFRLFMQKVPKVEPKPKKKTERKELPVPAGVSYLISDILLRLDMTFDSKVPAWRGALQGLVKHGKLRTFVRGHDYKNLFQGIASLSAATVRTYRSHLNTLGRFLEKCEGIEVQHLLDLAEELGLSRNSKSVLRTMRSVGEEKLFPEMLEQYRVLLLDSEYPKATVQAYISQIRTTFVAYAEYLHRKAVQEEEGFSEPDLLDELTPKASTDLLDELTQKQYDSFMDPMRDTSLLSLEELEEACGIREDPNPYGFVTPEELVTQQEPTKGDINFLAKEVDVALRRIDCMFPFATVNLSADIASISSGGKTKNLSRHIVSRAWPTIKRSLEKLGYKVETRVPKVMGNFTWKISVPNFLSENWK